MAKIDLIKMIQVGAAVTTALSAAAASPKTNMTERDVDILKPIVEQQIQVEVKKAESKVNSVVENLNNREPLYQSRVFWGTVVAIGSQVAALLGHQIEPELQGSIVELSLQLVTVASAAYALYGRLTTKKPLGS